MVFIDKIIADAGILRESLRTDVAERFLGDIDGVDKRRTWISDMQRMGF